MDACFAIYLFLLTVDVLFTFRLLVLDEVECGEDVGAIGRDGHGVLEVGRGLAVAGTAGPAVLPGELDVLGAHTHHRFNRYDHSFLEQRACSGDAEVGHIGRFVHLESHAVAAKFTHDGVAVLLAVHLDCMADVAHSVARFAAVEAEEEGFAGDLHQALHLGADGSDGKRVGRVGHVTVELNDTVERDVVAFLDEDVAGYAMDNDIIDRDAKGCRETLEAFAQRFGAIVADELLADFVEEGGGDTWTDMTAHLRESFPEEEAGITYELDFFFSLEQYHSFPLDVCVLCLDGHRGAALDAAGLGETVVVAHQEVALDLLEGVEDDTDEDEQGGTTIELGKLGVDTEEADNGRQDSHDGEEDGAGKGNLGEDALKVFGCLLAGLDTGDESTVLLHVLSHLVGVNGNGGVEVGEHDHKDEEHQVVPEAVVVGESHSELAAAAVRESHEGDGQEHDCLGKDDGHDASCVDLDGDVLADAAILFVTNNALGILHGDTASALHKEDDEQNDHKEYNKLEEEHHQATTFGETGGKLGREGEGETGDDTNHNQKRDTIADAFVGNALTKPHDEEGSADQDNDAADPEEGRRLGPRKGVESIGRGLQLHAHVGDVGRSLGSRDGDGEPASDLIHFSTATFTFPLHFLELGDHHHEQLNHDGCRDVRHDAQGEDGGIGECSTREHVEKAHQALRTLLSEDCELRRVDTWQDDIGADAVNQHQANGVEDSLPQVFNRPDVLKCLY